MEQMWKRIGGRVRDPSGLNTPRNNSPCLYTTAHSSSSALSRTIEHASTPTLLRMRPYNMRHLPHYNIWTCSETLCECPFPASAEHHLPQNGTVLGIRSWIRIRNYLYRSGSFHKPGEKFWNPFISITLWLLNDLLSLKTVVNVPSVSNKQNFVKKHILVSHWRKEKDPDPSQNVTDLENC